MYVIQVRNVHQALPLAMNFLAQGHDIERTESRNGEVLKCKQPVTTRYSNPTERVLFWPERNANPFFHFMECLWMISGRKDVRWISQFNKSFGQFSDNKKTFHGAYGDRWVYHFQMNQVATIVDILKKNPADRRAVLTMWDPDVDLGKEGLDFPCNTQIYFDATHGILNMTVCCRSNDVVWGAYGANAVHMSFLQEVMASMIGIPVGTYWQLSNNWHGYTKTLEPVFGLSNKTEEICPYETGEVVPYKIMNIEPQAWFEDLEVFLDDGPIVGFRDPFFRRVVTPIYHAWKAKEMTENENRFDHALEIIDQCAAIDWKKACTEWLIRNRK